MAKSENYEFQYLHEEIETDSDMIQGPHKKIAEQICHLIGNEDKSATIGIEGKWGSGKSTLISLIKSGFNGKPVIVCYFDSWAHEGDSLLSAFLLQLADDLFKMNNLTLTSCKNYIMRTTTEKTIRPVVSRWGFCFLISLLLVPMGSVLFQIPNIQLKSVSLLFLMAPALIIILHIIINQIQNKPLSDVWSILTKTSNTELITKSVDCSSVEFEKKFKNVLKKYFDGSQNKSKVVIVLDNLDRISEESFFNIWSTFQIFFQSRSQSGPSNRDDEWFSNVWFVVPYDSQYLKGIKSETFNMNSFLDKNFQLRYEVPSFHITEWTKLAQKLIDKATQNWIPSNDEKDNKNDMLKIFIRTRDDLKIVPTPRQLRLYINQVCLTKQLYPDFSVAGISYYTIYRHLDGWPKSQKDGDNPDTNSRQEFSHIDNETMVKLLISGGLPKQDDLYFLPADIKGEMAALACGAETVEKGLELLLYQPIKNAIVFHDPEELKRLMETHKDAFWPVFDIVLGNIMLNLGSVKTIKSCMPNEDMPELDGFYNKINETLKTKDEVQNNHMWEHIKNDFNEPGDISHLIDDSWPLIDICKYLEKQEKYAKISKHLRESLLIFIHRYVSARNDYDDKNMKTLILFIEKVDSICSDSNRYTPIEPLQIELNDNNKGFMAWINESIGNTEIIPGYKWLIPKSVRVEKIHETISEKMASCSYRFLQIFIYYYIGLSKNSVLNNQNDKENLIQELLKCMSRYPTDEGRYVCVLESIFDLDPNIKSLNSFFDSDDYNTRLKNFYDELKRDGKKFGTPSKTEYELFMHNRELLKHHQSTSK